MLPYKAGMQVAVELGERFGIRRNKFTSDLRFLDCLADRFIGHDCYSQEMTFVNMMLCTLNNCHDAKASNLAQMNP